MSPSPALTAADIAEVLGMNRTAVYQLFTRQTHPIPHIRTGETAIRVRPETFEKWLREEEQMSVGTTTTRRRA